MLQTFPLKTAFLFIREDPAFITNDEPQHDRGASLTQKLSGLCASLRRRV